MLDKLMLMSLKNRLMVLISAIIVFISGLYIARQLPVDVFPDLTAPTVTIMTEAHGMAPEEVEMLVTFPIETAVNGASGVRRVRSTSIQGFSTIFVEFDWGTDIYKARQIVNEKLQAIQNRLPDGVDQPALAPITSIMGEIMMVALTSDSVSQMDLRTMADYNIRRRILAIPGVAQVKVYGGEVKQFQVLVNPDLLRKYEMSLNQVLEATSNSNINAAGGFYVHSGKEYLIRGMGRINELSDLEYTVITTKNNIPILLKDIGKITIGAATKLGEASINQKYGVLIVISKQPDANTLLLTGTLNESLESINKTLPENIKLHNNIFKQADFIEIAVNNVAEALIIGSILVIFVLMLFLGNIRTTLISTLAIPLSLMTAIIFLKLLDLSINTMTLGGMAIAIGVLVDDAIIYVENVYRRLKGNYSKPKEKQDSYFNVIYEASKEIRTPIAMATFIIIVVFIPLFFLSGLEGKMLKPLGIAYVVSIFASLIVAVTVTPALSSLLLKKIMSVKEKEVWIVKKINKIYVPLLEWAISNKGKVLGIAAGLMIMALVILPFLGRSFLPEFNEGTFNISVATVPGTSLEESNKIGEMAEKIILANPYFSNVARRTGRTELDEHSLGSHAHEIEVKMDLENSTKEELLEYLRSNLTLLPGTIFTVGQPISHRIDHMLSGTRAGIAVKIFGSGLHQIRTVAHKIEEQMHSIEGVVDLAVDQQVEIPQVRIRANRNKMALYGLTVADLDQFIDIAFLGVKTSQVYEQQNQFDLLVRYDLPYRNDLDAVKNSLIDTPTGARIPLEMVTDIVVEYGPNYISRENVQRKIVVQANVAGRDLHSVINEIKTNIEQNVKLPANSYIEYGGQFESAAEATRMITLLSILSIMAIFVALYMEFKNFRQVLLVMVNLPLALIGGIVLVALTDGIISIASLVGFITLFGIAVRNGIIMVSHYNHLIIEEGKTLKEAVLQGSMERLNPILMTALTTGLALLPLALAADKPGSEIQAPMSIVILGGLLTATFLNMIVIPVLFQKWGMVKKS